MATLMLTAGHAGARRETPSGTNPRERSRTPKRVRRTHGFLDFPARTCSPTIWDPHNYKGYATPAEHKSNMTTALELIHFGQDSVPKPDVPSSSVESVDIQSGAEASRQTVTDTDQDNSTSQEDATPVVIAPQIVPVSPTPPPAQQSIVVPMVEMPKPPVMDLPPIFTPTPKPVVAEEKAVIVPAAPVSPVMITAQADIGGNATKIVLERDASVQQVWDAVRVECDRLQIKGHLSSIVNASGVALPGKDGQGMTGKHGLTELATISVVVIPEPNTSDNDVKQESSQSDLDIKAHMREAAYRPLLNEQIILGDEPAQSRSKRVQTFSPRRKSKLPTISATKLVERAFDAGQEQSRCSIVVEDSDTGVAKSTNSKRQNIASSLVKDALAEVQLGKAAQKHSLNEHIILGDDPAQSKSKRTQIFPPSRKSHQFSRASRPQARSQQRQSAVSASVSKPEAGKKFSQYRTLLPELLTLRATVFVANKISNLNLEIVLPESSTERTLMSHIHHRLNIAYSTYKVNRVVVQKKFDFFTLQDSLKPHGLSMRFF